MLQAVVAPCVSWCRTHRMSHMGMWLRYWLVEVKLRWSGQEAQHPPLTVSKAVFRLRPTLLSLLLLVGGGHCLHQFWCRGGLLLCHSRWCVCSTAHCEYHLQLAHSLSLGLNVHVENNTSVTGPNSDIFTPASTELPQLAFLFLLTLTLATRGFSLPQVTHISNTVSANTYHTQKAQIIATGSKYKYPPHTEDTNIYGIQQT